MERCHAGVTWQGHRRAAPTPMDPKMIGLIALPIRAVPR